MNDRNFASERPTFYLGLPGVWILLKEKKKNLSYSPGALKEHLSSLPFPCTTSSPSLPWVAMLVRDP